MAGTRIHRDGALLATLPGAATAYTDDTAGSATTHTYELDATDAAGNVSARSAPLAVATVDASPPGTPSGPAAAATGPNRVAVSWSAATDDVGVTGYTVYRNDTPVGTAAGTAFTDTTALSETTYSYQVVARDAAGNWSAPAGPSSVTTPAPDGIAPVADTYVRAASPTSNYGRATTVRVDATPTVTYLKFTVTGLGGTVARARLRIWTTAGTTPGILARGVADTSWPEYTTTWNNAPAVTGGNPVGASGRTVTDSWATIDITPLIAGNGTYTIALTNNGTSSSCASREAGPTRAPQLLLDTAG